MASLEDSAALSSDQAFQNRVGEAVARTAYNIVAIEDGSAPDHARREAFARQVVRDVGSYTFAFTRMVVANPSIADKAPNGADVPDNDILFVVDQVWLDFAPPLPPEPAPLP